MQCGERFWTQTKSGQVCEPRIRLRIWRQRRGSWFAATRDTDEFEALMGAWMLKRFNGGRGRLRGSAGRKGACGRRSWKRHCVQLWTKCLKDCLRAASCL